MNKKSNNNALRVMIAAGSVIGFLGGWIALGNANNSLAGNSAPTVILETTKEATGADAILTDDSLVNQAVGVPASVPVIPIQTTTTQTQTNSSARTQTRLRTGGS